MAMQPKDRLDLTVTGWLSIRAEGASCPPFRGVHRRLSNGSCGRAVDRFEMIDPFAGARVLALSIASPACQPSRNSTHMIRPRDSSTVPAPRGETGVSTCGL